ncbi:hypothetical protein [Nonomuraea recticatena]|uniref:hypothetical protein n=1 Tax=Nonomuraea recticatena TaxID=46178 RepID=UPI0031F982B7
MLFAVVSRWLGGGPESVQAAGTNYTVTVLPADPVEVRVTSGKAETVTLAAAMPGMGHALPPVGTVQAGQAASSPQRRCSITVAEAQEQETIIIRTVVGR